jgi:tetratricopeptide (TPR) repeat protein
MQHQHYPDALRHVNHAIESDRQDAMAYILRGQVLTGLDEPQQALADFKRALSINPKLETALVDDAKAKCYVDISQLDQAMVEVNKAIKLEPSGERFRLRGDIFGQLNKTRDAVESFTQAIKASPKSTWSYFDRGNCYARLNMNKEAIADYTQVIKLMPTEPSAYVSRAKLYDKLGLHDLAQKDREQAKQRTDFSM